MAMKGMRFMVIRKRFNSIKELQKVQEMACKVDEDVFIHSLDGSIKVDAKSFIGLFSLDFSEDVNVVTESKKVAKFLEK